MPFVSTSATADAARVSSRAAATPSGHRWGSLPRDLLALWHLLSLDAPSVAALWTLFFARSMHRTLPASAPLSMFLAVWMLYVAARLLDSRILIVPRSSLPLTSRLVDVGRAGLEARHYFHHRHRRPLLAMLVMGAIGLAALLPRLSLIAIRLDLLLASALFAYFLLIHATGSAHRLPKEISVGLFFSAAVAIPTVAGLPGGRLHLLPMAVLFALLCSLNCLFIYRWEHGDSAAMVRAEPLAHPLTRMALHRLKPLCLALVAASVLLSAVQHQAEPLALALSAVLLLTLDRFRAVFAPLILRAAADGVLLTPLLLIVLQHVL